MLTDYAETRVHQRLINSLYNEALVLADEARGYFDNFGSVARANMSQMGRVRFSCESLKVTTRLMHSIAWLLTWRAVLAGELSQVEALDLSRRLGEAPVSDLAAVTDLPEAALELITASKRLHDRLGRLDNAQALLVTPPIVVREMQDRLLSAF